MKKFLFVSINYPPTIGAGADIVEQVCLELVRRGHEVTVFSCALTADRSFSIRKEKGVLVYSGYRPAFFKDIMLRAALQLRIHAPRRWRALLFYEQVRAWRGRGDLRKMQKEISPDVVVSVCYPLNTHILCGRLRDEAPFRWCAYYLDSFYNNRQYDVSEKGRRRLFRKEREYLKNADRLLIPDCFFGDYSRWGKEERLLRTEYPFLGSLNTLPGTEWNRKQLDCLYLGTLYADIRNPEFMFSFFDLFAGRLPVNLLCMGMKEGFEDGYFEGRGTASFSLVSRASVPHEETSAYVEKADILLSIGNIHANQMPSKIVDYIRTGKPVLHFYKIPDCPARKLLDRYPLAFCVNEKAQVTEEVLRAFEDFCDRAVGSRLNGADIVKLFPEHTIEAIADNFFK